MAGVLVAKVDAQPLGTAFTYQGQLTDSGEPANGLYDFQVCLFAAFDGGGALACTEDLDDVPVEDGLFTIALDFGAEPFAGQQRFLELRVRPGASAGSYTVLTPRQLVRPTPEALRANVASEAPWSGLTGVPPGFADGIDNDSGGTVTSITAGTGLAGGTITASGTIGIANGGVGLAQINSAQVQARIGAGCAIGQYVRSVNADGSVVCGTDAVGGAGTVTSISAGTGLAGGTITASGTIGIADGGVGLAQINSAQVQARIGGSCSLGSYLRGINADGSVLCEDLPGLNILGVLDIDSSGLGGRGFTSLAIGHDGLPVISFSSRSGALYVAKCADAACTGAATISTVETWNTLQASGFRTSIAVGNDGLPVIAYTYANTGNLYRLRVAKCANPACTGSATLTFIDTAFPVGDFNAIAIGNDGVPVISYYGSGALKFARCANANCTGTAFVTTVDDSANLVGQYTSLAIGNDGLPVISYHDATAGTLKVARCPNINCLGTASITTVDSSANTVGSFSSLAIGSDGLPVISYRDATAGTLKVAKCANAACTGAATISIIDGMGSNVGHSSSLAIGSDGRPVISYRDATAGSLKVARCSNASCTGSSIATRSSRSTVHSPADSVGFSTSIGIGSQGLPVIAYTDSSSSVAMVAACGSLGCR
ncbi:MAG TPA: hypothetical protein PKZ76_13195 [Xanthomonadaceae bacterium]|nr:hypothetical protein [Xanthomonadaceae bacterium]